jgi:hypothetical protein
MDEEKSFDEREMNFLLDDMTGSNDSKTNLKAIESER